MSYFLMEQGILQEAEIVSTKDASKAVFRLAIQDADTINQNKRMYPRNVLEEGIRNCEKRIRSRSFLGEMDHPLPTGNFDEVRQTTVMLSEVSHLIRDTDWQGNILYGEFETLNTPKGNIALNLIKDRIGVGTSMRGLAELERKPEYNMVKGPLYIVTYDLVSNPSHQIAKVDAQTVRFEAITESTNGLVCVNGQCYLPDYFDKIVETRMVKFFKKWV